MTVARGWMEIESQLSSVRIACAAVRALCRELGGSAGDADALELALAEALNNVIEHAYRGEAGHRVVIEFGADGRRLIIRVRDTGATAPADLVRRAALPCFDPAAVAKLPEGGFGLGLIQAGTQELTYQSQDGQNILTFSRMLGDGPWPR